MRLLPRTAIPILCVCLLAAARGTQAQGLRAVWARDAMDVMAVGDNGKLDRTLDGGTTWTETVLGSPGATLRGVAARGFTFLVVADAGVVWKSIDSGGNWTQTTAVGG